MLPFEAEIIRELVETFSARRIRTPDEPACHLCRRQREDLNEDEGGLFWCPPPQWGHCNKIARARLQGWTGYR